MTTPRVVMYARERFCPDVKRSRQRLRDLGIEWQEHDIERDDHAAQTVERLTGKRSVPTIVIGDTVIVEPSNRELDDALSSAGYTVDAG